MACAQRSKVAPMPLGNTTVAAKKHTGTFTKYV